MDYATFYPQNYPNLTSANLQANNTYTLNNPSTQQNGVQQLQQNMFYLDPFDNKPEQSADLDHASFSSTPVLTILVLIFR